MQNRGGVEDADIQADAKEVPCAGTEPIPDDRTEVTKNLTALDRQFLDKLFEIVSDNIDNEDLSVGFRLASDQSERVCAPCAHG